MARPRETTTRNAAGVRPSVTCARATSGPRAINPAYTRTFVFTNDYSALLPDGPAAEDAVDPLLSGSRAGHMPGGLLFSPARLTLAEMPVPQIRNVVDVWAEQIEELGRTYRWVQVFENKGDAMGCSNPHPHGQIWASDTLPEDPAREDRCQAEYLRHMVRRCWWTTCSRRRHAGAWSSQTSTGWPWSRFGRRGRLKSCCCPAPACPPATRLTDDERDNLADVLKRLLTRYDNLFERRSRTRWVGMGPVPRASRHWQLHAHFYPPLLRSATVKKFMVGYEMLAEAQRDLTPEQAATRLREQSEMHYRLEPVPASNDEGSHS